MQCVKQMSSYLAVMLSGTRPAFGRVESKHPYRTERGTAQEGPFDSLCSLRVTPDIRFSFCSRLTEDIGYTNSGTALARPVYATEKSAEVTSQRNDGYC